MTVVLWHIEVSHYSEKARWALDLKEIPHERRVPMPGLHGVSALMHTRGAQRRLPVLALGGRRIGDSTEIIAALERHTPDPPLYPADPAECARALELEDWFDEHLGPTMRRFVWHHTLASTDLVAGTLFTKPSPARERMLRATAPVAKRAVALDYGVSADSAVAARAAVVASMDRVEAELQPSGYLVGDAFSVADLTASALFTPLLDPPQRPYVPAGAAPAVVELRDELLARPGGAWVMDMYARHRGVSAEIGAPAAA